MLKYGPLKCRQRLPVLGMVGLPTTMLSVYTKNIYTKTIRYIYSYGFGLAHSHSWIRVVRAMSVLPRAFAGIGIVASQSGGDAFSQSEFEEEGFLCLPQGCDEMSSTVVHINRKSLYMASTSQPSMAQSHYRLHEVLF